MKKKSDLFNEAWIRFRYSLYLTRYFVGLYKKMIRKNI